MICGWVGHLTSQFILHAHLYHLSTIRDSDDEDDGDDDAYILFPMGQALFSIAINISNINIY